MRVAIAEKSQQKLANELSGISASLIAAYEDRETNIPTTKIDVYRQHFNKVYGTKLDWNRLMTEDLETKGKDYLYTEPGEGHEKKLDELRELIEELEVLNKTLQASNNTLMGEVSNLKESQKDLIQTNKMIVTIMERNM